MTDRPISDYAIIGDTDTTALVSRDGSVDWLCWPRHDSPAAFLALLDGDKGGFCRILLDGVRTASRRYRPGTAVLETTFVTDTGAATLIDFIPLHSHDALPEEGPDGDAQGRLVRRLICEEGWVSGRWVVRPTFDYARAGTSAKERQDGSVLFRGYEETISVVASVPLTVYEAVAEGTFGLCADQTCDFVLAQHEDGAFDTNASLAATITYWEA